MKRKIIFAMLMIFAAASLLAKNYEKEFEKISTKIDVTNYRESLNKYQKLIEDAEKKIKTPGLFYNPEKEKTNLQQALNKKDANGLTPIFYAVQYNEYNLIQKMIEYGADVNIFDDKYKQTPIFWALENENPNINVIQLLINHGASCDEQINNSDWTSYTPFMAACQTGNEAVIELVLSKTYQFDVKSTRKNSDGEQTEMTPFAYLCLRNAHEYEDVLSTLLDKSVSVDKTWKIGSVEMTPFQYLCSEYDSKKMKIMQKMIEKGANVETTFNDDGDTLSPFYCAVASKDSNFINLILGSGKEFDKRISIKNDWNGTVLGYLAYYYDRSSYNSDWIIKKLVEEKNVEIDSYIYHGDNRFSPLSALCSNTSKENDCTDLIKYFLENGASPNFVSMWTRQDKTICTGTPLHIVASKNNRDVYALLKSNGGNIHQADSDGKTPVNYLEQFIKNNADRFAFYYEEIGSADEKLISDNVNLNEKSSDGKTVLQISLLYKDENTALKILAKNIDWKIRDDNEKNAFVYALENSCHRVVNYFIENKIPIGTSIFNVIDYTLDTGDLNYLDHFLKNEDYSDVVIKFGIDKRQTDVGQIVYAALKGQNQYQSSKNEHRNLLLDTLMEAGEKISKEGLDKKEISAEGKTPVVAAMSLFDDEETALRLLKTGADISRADNDGMCAKDYAFAKNYTEIIQWMLDENVELGNALFYAIDNELNGYDSHISEFLKREKNFNVAKFEKSLRETGSGTIYYVSPVIYTVLINPNQAISEKRIKILRELLSHGFDINKTVRGGEHNGNSALITAVKNNNYEVADYLVKTGADLEIANRSGDGQDSGKTALFFALKSENIKIPDLILRAMNYKIKDIQLQSKDEKNVTLLMYLAKYGSFDTVNSVISNFVDENPRALERKDSNGLTPFLYAACFNHDYNVMRLLRMYGANVYATDNSGNNAKTLAENNGNDEIIKTKLENWGVY